MPRKPDWKRSSEWLLLALAVVASVMWIATAVGRAGVAQGDDDAEVAAQPVADEDPSQPPPKQRINSEYASRINARDVFVPRPPKGFRGRFTGVLGDQAVINNQFVRVGQNAAGAIIKEIGPDWVEIEFEGNTQRLWLFGPDASWRGARDPSEANETTEPVPSVPMSVDALEQLRRLPPEERTRVIQHLPPEVAQHLEQN